MSTTLKSWAKPFVTSAVIIIAVTGTMMFFNIEAGFIKPVHEWLSWAMTAAVILHVAANWKLFMGYFSKKPAMVIIGTGILITTFSIFLPSSHQPNPRKNIFTALESARLETISTIAGQTSQDIIDKLELKGITIVEPSMSIHDIATQNGKKEMAVLGIIFDKQATKE